MRTRQPEEKIIGGMRSLNRRKAAEYLGRCVNSLDILVARSRSGKAENPIRFIQEKKGSYIWFPIPWLDEFLGVCA